MCLWCVTGAFADFFFLRVFNPHPNTHKHYTNNASSLSLLGADQISAVHWQLRMWRMVRCNVRSGCTDIGHVCTHCAGVVRRGQRRDDAAAHTSITPALPSSTANSLNYISERALRTRRIRRRTTDVRHSQHKPHIRQRSVFGVHGVALTTTTATVAAFVDRHVVRPFHVQ